MARGIRLLKKIVWVCCVCFVNSYSGFAQPVFTVNDYGAVGDGHTLCTRPIQKAVDACARAGGGKIVFRPGRYRTGPVFLKSNLHIEIGAGTVILFDSNFRQTPVVDGSWEGIDRKVYASLFYGQNLENITISGRGTIDGQGAPWWAAYRSTEELRKKMGINTREPENPEGSALPFPRPRVINLYHCRNVLIRDITILNSPSWTIHPLDCENVTIEQVTIRTPYGSPNTDGIDPESCRNVRILNCFIDCGDDCIAIKSGYNESGCKKVIPCEDVVIANCTFAHGRSAIGIGSEVFGGVRNVVVSNCIFNGTLRGIRIKTARGRGSVVENINVSGIVMDNISEGISLEMNYDGGPDTVQAVSLSTPVLRNIRLSNITGTHIRQAMNLSGLPESPLHDIHFDHVMLYAAEGVRCRFASRISFSDCMVNAEKGSAFYISQSAGICFDNAGSILPQPVSPVISVSRSDGFIMRNCQAAKGTGILVKADRTKNVEYINNLPGKAEMINTDE